MEGCVLWANEGVSDRPLVVELATAEYAVEQDVIGQLMDDVLIPTSDGAVDLDAVYRVATQWWTKRGEDPWRQPTFISNLKGRNGIRIDGHTLYGYKINESVLTWPGMGV